MLFRSGEALGLSEELVWRHPFPGPGLAVRVAGEITPERLEILRAADEVLLEELRGSGVRASLIEPAATDTPLWDELDPDSDPNLPDRKDMMTPEQVADAIIFVVTRPEGVSVPHLAVERG